jgi:cytochrome c556
MRHWIVAVPVALWVATAAVAAFFFVRGHTAPGPDGRTAILLQAGERQFVMGEMRLLLVAVRDITEAIAEGSDAKVAKVARSVGMAAAHDAPATLLAKLPLEFKRLAMPLHGGFDDLAAAAEKGEPPAALAGRLARQLDQCAGCHEAYRFDPAG